MAIALFSTSYGHRWFFQRRLTLIRLFFIIRKLFSLCARDFSIFVMTCQINKKTYSTQGVANDAPARPSNLSPVSCAPWPSTFWSPKLIVSCPLSQFPRRSFVPIDVKIGLFVFENIVFTNLVTDKRTNWRTVASGCPSGVAETWKYDMCLCTFRCTTRPVVGQ